MDSFLRAAASRTEDATAVHECPICLCSPPDGLCRTVCNHVFCEDCLSRTFFATASSGACPLCRTQVSLYSTVSISTGLLLRTPDVVSPIGSTYLQLGALGQASYHFESLDSAYVSYESAPSSWLLDDSSRPPARKPFLSPSYDPHTRTFTGVIDWAPSAFGGDARWEYRMVFSDTFNIICAGELRRFAGDGTETLPPLSFPQTLVYWRQLDEVTTIVGTTFVQGESLGVASYHFERPHTSAPHHDELGDCYISYAAAPEAWTLDNGTRPPARKPFLHPTYDAPSRTFTGTIEWHEGAFGGDTRWEYTMVFAPNLATISGGEVRAFNAAGEPSKTHRFGANLFYRRHMLERAEMTEHLRSLGESRRFLAVGL